MCRHRHPRNVWIVLVKLYYLVVVFLVIVGFLLCYLSMCVKYEAIKPYYPGLTLWDYIILKDALRITPGENNGAHGSR